MDNFNPGPNKEPENNDKNNNGNGDKNNNNNKRNFQRVLIFVLVTLVTLLIMSIITRMANQLTTEEITYSQFLKMVEEKKIEKVTVESSQLKITPKSTDGLDPLVTYYTGIMPDDKLLERMQEAGIDVRREIPNNTANIIYNIASFLIPIVLIWMLMGFIMRRMGGGTFGMNKSNAKVYMEKKTGVTFKDVAGQEEAMESLQEVVDFLHNPKKYTAIGAKLPKGALLVGSPGTGKTLLAKAVAGEAGVPFFSIAGSDFVEMFVGVGASRVRDLFKEAYKNAPCIIFIDEIDAIGKSREGHFGGGNDEREQTLNQLLAEMDGFDTTKGILILAATNRPEVLDKALLRPGRFDRRIIVDKPDLKGRLDTLKVHSVDVKMDETVDLEAIALASAGLVGSDLANIINEAAIAAVKHGRTLVSQQDLFEAFELVAVGGKEKKNRAMSDKERHIVAYHEVGHALVMALQKNTEPVQKITIVPRTMGALGYTLQTPEEEKFLHTKEELMAKIVSYMAGRAAEELIFKSSTSGAANDIEMATRIARAMVTQYGMSEEFGMMGLETVENQYLEGRAMLNCGDKTAAAVDKVVKRIIKEAYAEAMKLLKKNRDILDKISEHLYEKETITGKEFMKIFRELKGLPEPEEEDDDSLMSGKKVGANVDVTVDDDMTESAGDANDIQDSKSEPSDEDISEDETTDGDASGDSNIEVED